jgi:RNA polymerase sigma-70 factor, ECF subfamily
VERQCAFFVIRSRACSHLSQVQSQAPSFASLGADRAVSQLSYATPLSSASAARPTEMARTDLRLRAAVRDHLPLVWRVLRRAGLGPADAEDASQDVFWVLAQRVADVPERAQRSFLVSTALRVASDRKASKWHRSVSAGLDTDGRASEAPLPDEALDLRRAGALLDEALDCLDASDRAVFILAELEQMSRREVAEALTIPEGTVASRLRRAREALELAIRRLRAQPRTLR